MSVEAATASASRPGIARQKATDLEREIFGSDVDVDELSETEGIASTRLSICLQQVWDVPAEIVSALFAQLEVICRAGSLPASEAGNLQPIHLFNWCGRGASGFHYDALLPQ